MINDEIIKSLRMLGEHIEQAKRGNCKEKIAVALARAHLSTFNTAVNFIRASKIERFDDKKVYSTAPFHFVLGDPLPQNEIEKLKGHVKEYSALLNSFCSIIGVKRSDLVENEEDF